MECEHKYIHKQSIRQVEHDGRSFTRFATWINVEIYFCEKCLDKKTKKQEWSGQPHYSDRPEWTKIGEWNHVTKYY